MPVRSRDLTAITSSRTSVSVARSDGSGEVQEVDIAEAEIPGFSTEVDDRNTELKATILDIEDLLDTTAEVQVEAVRSQQETLNTRLKASELSLQQFDEGYQHPTPSHFNREKLLELLGLSVSTPELRRNITIAQRAKKLGREVDARGSLEGPHFGGSVNSRASRKPSAVQLEEPPVSERRSDRVSACLSPDEDRQTIITLANTDVSVGTIDLSGLHTRIEELTRQLQRELRPEEVRRYTKELGRVLTALFPPDGDGAARNLFAMNKVANVDVLFAVKEWMRDTTLEMNELEEAAVAAAVESDASRRDDATELIEPRCTATVEAYHKALSLAKDRMSQVLMDRDDEGSLRGTVEQAREAVQAWLMKHRTARQKLVSASDADAGALAAERTRREAEDTAAAEAYAAAQAQSQTDMQGLQEQQGRLWDQVAQLVAEIGRVGSKRKELLDQHMARTEAELKRQRFYDEFETVARKHADHLAMLSNVGREAMRILDHLDTAADHLSMQVDAKNFEEGLDELRRDELARFVRMYPKYVDTGNHIVARRDARQVVAQRTVTVAESNAKLASTTLIPERKQYTDLALKSQREVQDLEQQQQALCRRLEQWETHFHYAADKLEDLFDIEVDDPVPAAEREWSSLVGKTKDATKAAHEKEATSVIHDVEEEDADKHRLESDLKVTEEKRLKRKESPPRRPKSGTRRQRLGSRPMSAVSSGVLSSRRSVVSLPPVGSADSSVVADQSP